MVMTNSITILLDKKDHVLTCSQESFVERSDSGNSSLDFCADTKKIFSSVLEEQTKYLSDMNDIVGLILSCESENKNVYPLNMVLNLIPHFTDGRQDDSFRLDKGFSTGFGYLLLLYKLAAECYGKPLGPQKKHIFATGAIADGKVENVEGIDEKLNGAIAYYNNSLKRENNSGFKVIYPYCNDKSISNDLREEIKNAGGELIPVQNIPQLLTAAFGEQVFNYKGDQNKWLETLQHLLEYKDKISKKFSSWLKNKDSSPKEAKKNLLTDSRQIKQGTEFIDSLPFIDKSLKEFVNKSTKKKRNRKLFAVVLSAFFVSIMAVSAAIYHWDQTRIKSKYYAHFATKWGVPVGVTELSVDETAKKERHYRLDYQGSKLIEMSFRNSAGTLCADDKHDDIAVWQYSYKANNQLYQIEKRSKTGAYHSRAVYDFQSNKLAIVRFQKKTEIGDQPFVMSYQGEIGNKTEITQNRIYFDEKGGISKRVFLNNNDVVTSDQLNTYGKIFEYYGNGLLRQEFYIDKKGKKTDRKGRGSILFERDNKGNVVKQIYLDINGIEIIDIEYKYSVVRREFDEVGNDVTASYYDTNDHLTINNKGYAKATFSYDDKGNGVEAIFFDADEHKTLHKNGYYKILLHYDNKGNHIESKYFGLDEGLILHKDGNAKVEYIYNDKGLLIDTAFYGKNDRLTLIKSGYARKKCKYDEDGRVIETSYYDTSEKPVLSKYGYTKAKYGYDAFGKHVESAYYGIDGLLTFVKGGFAKINYAYDAKNRLNEVRFFGVNDEAVMYKDGFAKILIEYDGNGNQTEAEYFGLTGEAILNKNGNAKVVHSYDEKGYRTESAHYGTNGELVLIDGGYAKTEYRYDENGNVIEITYYGTDSKPIINKSGYAKEEYSYDDMGYLTTVKHYDKNSRLTLIKLGYAKVKYSYDVFGNIIESSYYGTDETPILNKDGYARIKYMYDDRHRRVKAEFFGKTGGYILNRVGCASMEDSYDERDNHIGIKYFGIDGQLVLYKNSYAEIRYIYDEFGRIIEWQYYGIDSKPVLNEDGFFRRNYEYDRKGNVLEIKYFDTNNKLINANGKFAMVIFIYDLMGNKTSMILFDENEDVISIIPLGK